jgi:hypothetical protein
MRRVMLAVLMVACSGPSTEECLTKQSEGSSFSTGIFARNERGCSTNADCVTVRAMLSCYTGCPKAISASRRAAVESELAGLNETLCAGSACMINEGCNPAYAQCVAGVCRTVQGVLDAGRPDGG